MKKSKAVSSDQLDDVSTTSSAASLDASGQRKPDEASFLGEISAEDSSESGDEFENGGSNLKGINCQGSVKSEQTNNLKYSWTDERSSEVKDSSELASSSSSCEGTSNTEASSVGTDSSVSMGTTEEGLFAIKNETSVVGADLSTASEQTEEKFEGEKLSAQEEEGKDSSLNSSEPANDAQSTSATSVSCAELPGMTEEIALEEEASNSAEKQEDCDSGKGSCLGDKDGVLCEFVEGSLSGELVNASESIDVETKVEGKKSKDSPLEQENDGKKGDAMMEGSEAIDLGTLVAEVNEQNCKSDSVSEEQSDSVEEPTEGLPKENQEDERKDQSTSEEGILNQQNNEGKTKDEQHENLDMELNNEPVEEKRPEDQVQIGKDDTQQTESSKDNERDSNEQEKQGIENQETNES